MSQLAQTGQREPHALAPPDPGGISPDSPAHPTSPESLLAALALSSTCLASPAQDGWDAALPSPSAWGHPWLLLLLSTARASVQTHPSVSSLDPPKPRLFFENNRHAASLQFAALSSISTVSAGTLPGDRGGKPRSSKSTGHKWQSWGSSSACRSQSQAACVSAGAHTGGRPLPLTTETLSSGLPLAPPLWPHYAALLGPDPSVPSELLAGLSALPSLVSHSFCLGLFFGQFVLSWASSPK